MESTLWICFLTWIFPVFTQRTYTYIIYLLCALTLFARCLHLDHVNIASKPQRVPEHGGPDVFQAGRLRSEMDMTGIASATNQLCGSRRNSVQKVAECLGFHMLFELWLFPHKKIHICFGGHATASGGLKHNVLIQYQKDIYIHCQ